MKQFLIALFVAFPSLLFSQRGLLQFSREEGMLTNETHDVVFDQKGFVWVATSKGIERFDGNRFIHFTHSRNKENSLSSNDIRALNANDPKQIWAATYNKGLISIQTESFEITNYSLSNIPSFPSNFITAIYATENQVWFTTLDGELCEFEPKTKNAIRFRPSSNGLATPIFSAIAQDKLNPRYMWLLSSVGIFRFDKFARSWKQFTWSASTSLFATQKVNYDNQFNSFVQDDKGNFYIGLESGNLLYFDQFQGLFKFHPIAQNLLLNTSISSIQWFDSKFLYICLKNAEICLFDTFKKEAVRYDESERTAIFPQKIAKKNSQLVIASSTSGLYVHDNSIIYGEKFKPQKNLITLTYSKGDEIESRVVLNGAHYEIEYTKNGKVTTIPLNLNSTPVLFEKMGHQKWLLIENNALHEVTENGSMRSRHFPFEIVDAIWLSKQLIFSTVDSRIISYSLHTGKYKVLYASKNFRAQSKLPEIIPLALCKSQSKCYFSDKDLLLCYDERSGTVKQLIQKNKDESDIITAMTFKKNKLWIGTKASGIWVYDLQTEKMNYNIKSLLSIQNYIVKELFFDDLNRLWISTPHFITIYDANTKNQFNLEKQNGIADVRKLVYCHHNFYFLQENGYIRSYESTPFPSKRIGKPYILGIHRLSNFERFPSSKVIFKYHENNLIFEYGILNLTSTEKTDVNYRLLGLDDQWISGNQRNEVLYYNLKSGAYTFEVKVSEGESSSVSRFHFTISKPFWQEWWFVVLSILAVVGSIWLFIWLRVKRIRNTEEMKTEFSLKISELESKALRAQMNPHFLFNSLNSIRLFILKNDVDSAADYIAKFSKLLRMILNYSRSDMISVYDEIQSLKLYLEFERLRFGKDFDFDLQIDGQEVLECQIPPLIIQPFIENAIWHGLMPQSEWKGILKVSFQKQQSGLYVMVQDNGVGREKAKQNNRKRSLKEGSVGLQITKERLITLSHRTKKQNDFEIEDLFDELGKPIGTLVTLYFET